MIYNLFIDFLQLNILKSINVEINKTTFFFQYWEKFTSTLNKFISNKPLRALLNFPLRSKFNEFNTFSMLTQIRLNSTENIKKPSTQSERKNNRSVQVFCWNWIYRHEFVSVSSSNEKQTDKQHTNVRNNSDWLSALCVSTEQAYTCTTAAATAAVNNVNEWQRTAVRQIWIETRKDKDRRRIPNIPLAECSQYGCGCLLFSVSSPISFWSHSILFVWFIVRVW